MRRRTIRDTNITIILTPFGYGDSKLDADRLEVTVNYPTNFAPGLLRRSNVEKLRDALNDFLESGGR